MRCLSQLLYADERLHRIAPTEVEKREEDERLGGRCVLQEMPLVDGLRHHEEWPECL